MNNLLLLGLGVVAGYYVAPKLPVLKDLPIGKAVAVGGAVRLNEAAIKRQERVDRMRSAASDQLANVGYMPLPKVVTFAQIAEPGSDEIVVRQVVVDPNSATGMNGGSTRSPLIRGRGASYEGE